MGPANLRRRLTLGLLVYSAVLTLVLIAFGFFLNQSIERTTRRSILSETISQQFKVPPSLSHDGEIKVYVDTSRGQGNANVPMAIYALPLGLHSEVNVDGRKQAVLVRDVDESRVFVALDISRHERTERRWLGAVAVLVLVGLALSVGVVWWLAGRLLAPVTDLAMRLDTLDPAARGARLSGRHPHREVLLIEGAANHFLERLDGFVQREREFIDTVSHELRTPIAVIRGASDVLESDSDAVRNKKPLARIRQAVEDMNETLTSLLFLAKDSTEQASRCELDRIVRDLIRDHAYLRADKAVVVRESLERTVIAAPPRLVAIAIGNLLRNALEHSTAGVITVHLSGRVLTIEDAGPGMSPEEISRLYSIQARQTTHRAPSRGIGLYVVGRICAQCGWTVRMENLDIGGTRATLDFSSAPLI